MVKNCHCGNTVSGGLLCLTHLGELLSELVQFLLQRSLLLLSGSHLVTNLTDLSGDASCNSNTSGLSCRNIGALCLKRGGESQLVSLNQTAQQLLDGLAWNWNWNSWSTKGESYWICLSPELLLVPWSQNFWRCVTGNVGLLFWPLPSVVTRGVDMTNLPVYLLNMWTIIKDGHCKHFWMSHRESTGVIMMSVWPWPRPLLNGFVEGQGSQVGQN